nr:uroporphyrinogen decarboxylase family protein [Candidatus Sigynarchaeum springense]
MNSRDLVLKALAHEETPRVPIGYNLKADHELQLKAMHGWDPSEIKRHFKIDLHTVYMSPTKKFQEKSVKATVSTSFADSFLADGKNGLYYDEWGVGYSLQKYKYRFVGAGGKVSLETSDIPKMVDHPVKEITLDALESYLERGFPDIDDDTRYDQMRKEIKLYKDDYAIEADMEMTLFEKSWYVCGLPNFLAALGRAFRKPSPDENKFVNKILDAMIDFRLKQIEKYLEIGGIDIIRFGDDVGMQDGLMFSKAIWRQFFKPRMKRLIDACKEEVHVYNHCDGDCTELIPDFIENGVEILNPLQPECMDTERIKREYGDKVTLYGTIGIQKPSFIGDRYPDVPKAEIDRLSSLFSEEVRTRKKTLGKGGGLILAPTNKLQPDTFIESIIALYKEMGRESSR